MDFLDCHGVEVNFSKLICCGYLWTKTIALFQRNVFCMMLIGKPMTIPDGYDGHIAYWYQG